MKMSFAAFAFLCSSVPQLLAADAVDDYVQSEMERQKIPGLSLLVVRNGEIFKIRGYGLANVEHQVPVTPDTIFQSGSIGKQFTAAAVLLLAERGELTLNDPLAMHFSGAPASWHEITIRQLLSHTSGMKDYWSEFDLRRDYTEDELLRVAMELPIQFEPGSQWSYSNSGYLVLGVLVSKLTGEHWSRFVGEQIFAPAGMKTARMTAERDIVPNRAAGYERREDGELRNQEWVSETFLSTGDGTLYFSARDLASWDRALRGREILSASSYEAWWTPIGLSGDLSYPYGLGWRIADQRGRRVIQHGGSWQGFQTYLARYVDDHITIAVLANVSNARPKIIAHEIAGLLDDDLTLPDLNSSRIDPDERRSERLREVLEAWGTWQTTEHMGAGLASTSTGSVREARNRRRVRQQLSQATSSWLADDELVEHGLKRRGGNVVRIAYYRLETPGAIFRYRFYLTSDNLVVDIVQD